jgi:hypothetical protein
MAHRALPTCIVFAAFLLAGAPAAAQFPDKFTNAYAEPLPCDTRADGTTFQRENAAEYVHSHVFVSMAAKRYARNEGTGGARDSRIAGASPGVARDQLWHQHFAALARIHARRGHEIPRQSRVGCILAAPGAPETGRLANAAAKSSRRARLRNVGCWRHGPIRRRRGRRLDVGKSAGHGWAQTRALHSRDSS